jgi:hypothetical protein
MVTPQTSGGSSPTAKPIRVGASILFVDRPGNKVREIARDALGENLESREVSYVSEHILRDQGGAVECAYQQESNNTIWYVTTDGALISLTWNREQEVAAWARHLIGATSGVSYVESIAVIPSADGLKDNLYLSIKRNVFGESVRYIEKLEQDFYPESGPANRFNMMFLDSFIVVDSPSGVMDGFLHLKGETVTLVKDGVYSGTQEVTSAGTIDTGSLYSELLVGYDYTSVAKSLPPEAGSAFGTSHGQIKQVKKMQARILNSLDFEYGWSGATLNSKTALELNKGQSSNFVTDTVELIPNAPYHPESQWTIQTSKPYPLNVLSVSLTVECGE